MSTFDLDRVPTVLGMHSVAGYFGRDREGVKQMTKDRRREGAEMRYGDEM